MKSKLLLEFPVESITEPSVEDLAKGIKSILSYVEPIEKKGLQAGDVISVKSMIAVNPKEFLNKVVRCHVTQSIISNEFSKPSIYYRALSIEALK